MNKREVTEWGPVVFTICGTLLTALAYVYPGTDVGRQGVFNIAMILVSSAAGAYGAKKLMSPSDQTPTTPVDPAQTKE